MQYTLQQKIHRSVDQLYVDCLQLRQYQKDLIKNEIKKLERLLSIRLKTIIDFFFKFQSLIPQSSKLQQKAKKFQWIKIYLKSPLILMYQFDEDLITYAIYYRLKIKIKNEEFQLKEKLNFQYVHTIVYDFISQINNKFCEFLKLSEQQQPTENKLTQNQMIQYGLNPEDILADDELQKIMHFLKEIPQNQIEKYLLQVINSQLGVYKDYYKPIIIVQDPFQNPIFNNGDFGEKPKFQKEQLNIKFNEYNETSITQKKPGFYIYKNEKSILIFIISTQQKVRIYSINKFDHYKVVKDILNQYQEMKIYQFRMIKMKQIEAFLVANFIYKTQIKNVQFIDKVFEFYSSPQVNQVQNYYRKQFENQEQIKNSVIQFIKKFIPTCNNYNDIYSEQFVEILNQKSQHKLNLLPIIDINQPNIVQQKKSQGLIVKANNLFGVIIIDHNKEIYFQNEKNNDLNIYQTNVQNIPLKVANYYISLILSKAQDGNKRLIRNFLEQRFSALEPILQLVK
ncbi:unnamed protein product [Paramecium sonneborni]|uniref:Uncharacterized protein n=1 Tax=Paramecium sonneborni TaxID=65129 RepID=A0A8S1M0N4_9CILI|nr:unnamed protein product [Paramecium sonneborni]